MKLINNKTALVMLSLFIAAISGCVDQQPSMSLEGSVLFLGEFNEEEQRLECETEVDPGSIENVSPRGKIDIEELASFGQEGPPFETGFAHNSFEFWAAIVNLLDDSTQVGSGEGGGNFEGLHNDQNFISITGATIRFPSELNKFDSAGLAKRLEKKELFSRVLRSNGGAALVHFPIFGAREIPRLRDFHRDAVIEELGQDSPSAVVPLIAEIQIEGETFSGRSVESNKFQFPIDICRDCPDITTTKTCEYTIE